MPRTRSTKAEGGDYGIPLSSQASINQKLCSSSSVEEIIVTLYIVGQLMWVRGLLLAVAVFARVMMTLSVVVLLVHEIDHRVPGPGPVM